MSVFFLIALAFVAGGGIAFVATRTSKKNPEISRALSNDFRGSSQQLTAGGERALTDLRLNDIIIYYDNDFSVEGRITYSQGGWEWYSFMLEDNGKKLWLSVEDDEGLELSIWKEIPNFGVSSPPPSMLEYEGERFQLGERGKAMAQSVGRTGRAVDCPVEYYDYESASGKLLSVEDWDGDIEISIGIELTESELNVFPGDNILT